MKTFQLIVAAALVLAASAAWAGPSTNLVLNGGFETGDFTNWTQTPAATGSNFGVSTYAKLSGSYGAYFADGTPGSYDQISQNIATTNGHNYTIDYWLSNGTDGASDGFFASWNGTQVPASVVLNQPTFDFTEYTFTIAATASSTALQFSGYESGGTLSLDDISVTDLGPSVPEPASAAMLLLGSAALLTRRAGRFRR